MTNKNNLKTKEEIIEIISKEKKHLSDKYKISEIGLFGSYIRGEQKKKSDIDILIDYDHNKKFSLFDLINLQEYLTSILGANVDIALKRTLKTAIGYYILKEVQYI